MLTLKYIGYVCIISLVESAKIFAIFSFPEQGKLIVATSLLNGLYDRGHDIVVVTSRSHELQFRDGIRHVEIDANAHLFDDVLSFSMEHLDNSFYKILQSLLRRGPEMCANVMYNEEVKRIMATETFNLIIIDIFMTESLFGLGEYFKAPLVGVGRLERTVDQLMRNNLPSSIIPNLMLQASFDMSFLQRLLNVILNLTYVINHQVLYLPQHRQLYEKLFPSASLTFEEARMNLSLLLLNHHFSLSPARPSVPNMIEVGGMHIRDTPEPLEANVQQFLDKSEPGVVYVNFETGIQSVSLTAEQLGIFLAVFNQLQIKVLWQSTETLAQTDSSNMMIIGNASLDSILSHPNVKLFISEGKYISMTTTIYYAKPILGIPLFGDQHGNVELAVYNGYALPLKLKKLNVPTLKMLILEMLNNPKYTEAAQQISKRFRDQPMKPLDKAIYWVEYVLRHRGAPHLSVMGKNLNFWQYYNVDVYLALLLVFGIFIGAVLAVVKLSFYYVTKMRHRNFVTNRHRRLKRD